MRNACTPAAWAATAILFAGATAEAAVIEPGTYRLHSAPGGGAAAPDYGLRLDELFDVTSGHDIFTFDFDGEGARMRLDYDGSSVTIHGTAFGGLDSGSAYDPLWSGLVEIDFTYSMVGAADGQDLIVSTPGGVGSGSLTWLESGEVIPLVDYLGANMHSFLLGGETECDVHGGGPSSTGKGKGAPKPKGKGAPKPKGKGAPKPKGKGAPKPKGKGAPKPKGKGAPKPKGKGTPKPKGKGEGGPSGNDDHGVCTCALSGIGWLSHSGGEHVAASDWRFQLDCEPVPVPPAIALGLAGLAAAAGGRRFLRK